MRLLRRPRAANRETERLATADSHRAAAAVRSRRRAHTPNRIRDNPLPVRAGAQDAVLFPCAQCRRVNAETARQLTHRQRWTVHQCRCHGGQSPQRCGYLGASFSLGEQRHVRTVDQAVGGLGVALVGCPHDFRGPLVP